MPRKKKQEIILEPKLTATCQLRTEEEIVTMPEEASSVAVEIDESDEDLHGEFSHTEPIGKKWSRPLRRL